jgi:OOP family OmpA-OmpF porin
MTEPLLGKLTSIVTPSTMTDIAKHLGVPEESVARGLTLSAATTFAAMADKAGDPEMMRQVVDTASRMPEDSMTLITKQELLDPASSLMSTGRTVLGSLFSGGTNWAASLIGREAGLGPGVTATIMSLGANALLNFIGRRVRDEGLTANSLASFLRLEAPGLRKMMPPAFADAFTTRFSEGSRALDINPVIAQGVSRERSWLPWVTMAALFAGALLWYGLRTPKISVPLPDVPTVGTTGTITTRDLLPAVPIPIIGTTDRLKAFIVSDRPVDTTTWFDFDRLLFDSGSATLKPESYDQLRSIAAILKAYPNAHVTIGGYTDNVGSSAANLSLSERRANNVRSELIGMGVAPNTLTAEGFGDTNPVGDNATDSGRAMNRRTSMLVTQK